MFHNFESNRANFRSLWFSLFIIRLNCLNNTCNREWISLQFFKHVIIFKMESLTSHPKELSSYSIFNTSRNKDQILREFQKTGWLFWIITQYTAWRCCPNHFFKFWPNGPCALQINYSFFIISSLKSWIFSYTHKQRYE